MHTNRKLGGMHVRKAVVCVRELGCAPSCVLCCDMPCHAVLCCVQDMEGACHCSVQPLSCGSDSEADDTAASAAPAAMQDAGAASTAPAAADGTASQQQQQQSLDEASEHEKEDEAEAKAAAEAAAKHHGQHQWQLGASLTVDSCLYAEILTAEGVPQLLKAFCCQHNMSWLDTYSSQGVVSQLEACIAKGDSCCRITVTPKE